jgi:methyl-accepting chemotaxis protein
MEATDQAFAGIKAAIENMGLRIGEVAEAAAQIGTGSQQIASATEEQSASIVNLAEVTDTLATNAEKLKDAVEMFEI